ncbi:nuclease SbcCD subunit D [Peptococcaceae bacterium CEB3]|nr:nuclease SbcCD subunit D [Peptococcaceae bacterium CEB3]
MRILHTSDWHLGCQLEGRSRQEEQEKFIDELCDIAKEEQVDLVLIAGDLFDTVNPPARAEELYYEALDRLARGGKRAVVVIAGNHDNPERLCAASPLAERHGIVLLGEPKETLTPSLTLSGERVSRPAAGRGWVELGIPGCRETAVVAMLPYPSESRLNEVLSTSLDEEVLRREYSQRISLLFGRLAAKFRPDSVNLAVSHLFVRGGLESDSERPIQLGSAPAVEPVALPAGADYIALGHLHRAQAVKGAPGPARYSGAPLAYSFSEAGQAKSVILLDVSPGRAATLREIVLNAGYPLVKWKAKEGLAQVYRWMEEKRDPQAWIDLEICLTNPLSPKEVQDLRRLRERIINIRPVFPALEQSAALGRAGLPIDELFRRFYRERSGGAEPGDELVRLFLSLLEGDDGRGSKGEEGESA